jgi:hypothetical protein
MRILLSRSLPVAVAIFVFAVSLAAAQTPSIFDIEFPIAELGNCADKTTCKAYCNEPANENACDAFARKFGIGSHDSGEDDKIAATEKDGGPDGVCGTSPDPVAACGSFCNEQANMETCIAYGEKHNLFPKEELAEVRKVRDALRGGATLPAGCTNAESCKQTCDNPPSLEVAKQCFAFAEKAGLLPKDVNRAQVEKAFEAIQSGKTPFKSLKDFQKCERPEDDATLQACVNFGIESGLIPEKEAELLRKTGGKGPGGCFGKACETYCDDPSHEDECVRFAEEYDLISPEDKAQMQEGMQKMQEGLTQAPPEVRECLTTTVGSEVLDQIAAGTKRLSRDLGEKMKSCFETFFKNRDDARGQSMGPAFPPEVKACLVERLGPDFMDRMQSGPTPEMEEQMRPCFEMQGKNGSDGPGMMPQNQGFMPNAPMPFPQGKPPVNCGSPEECKKVFEQFGPKNGVPGFPGEFPPSPNGNPGSPDEFQKEFNTQFEEQYKQQYQQEFEKQFNGQFPGGPTPGMMPYPGGPGPGMEPYQTFGPQDGSAPLPGMPYPYPTDPANQYQNYAPQGAPMPFPEGAPYPSEEQYPSGGNGSYPYPPMNSDVPPPSGDFQGPPPGGDYQAPPPGDAPPPTSYINPPSFLGFFVQLIFGIR